MYEICNICLHIYYNIIEYQGKKQTQLNRKKVGFGIH